MPKKYCNKVSICTYSAIVLSTASFLAQFAYEGWAVQGLEPLLSPLGLAGAVLAIGALVLFIWNIRRDELTHEQWLELRDKRKPDLERFREVVAVVEKEKVRRESELRQIPARAVVPGDILLLETGDRVPADARLIELSNLKINEATLTGGSMPLDKHTEALGKEVPIAERKNLAFMGTTVSYGRAMAVAVRTGMSTELGKIAGAIREVKAEKPPFRKVLVS